MALLQTKERKTHLLNRLCGQASSCHPKWTGTVIASGWGMFCGIDRVMFMSTLWYYLYYGYGPNDAVYFYGVTLIGYSLASVIFSYLNIYLAVNKGKSVFCLLIISDVLAILGNGLYFATPFSWASVCARFLAGSAIGAGTPMYAEVIDMVHAGRRSCCVITLLIARQFGLLLGPIVVISSHLFTIQVGFLRISALNFPGLFMCAAWILHLVFSFTLYPGWTVGIDSGSDHEDAVKLENREFERKTQKKSKRKSKDKPKSCVRSVSFITRRNILFLFCTLASYTCLTGFEALLPPFLFRLLSWSEYHLALVLFTGNVILLFVYPILRIISTKLKQEDLLIIGFTFLLISYGALLVVVIFVRDNSSAYVIASLMAICAAHVVGHPFVVMFSEALFLASLPVRKKEAGQVAQRAVMNMGIVAGAFIGGCMQMWTFLSVSTILGMTIIAFFCSLLGRCIPAKTEKPMKSNEDDT